MGLSGAQLWTAKTVSHGVIGGVSNEMMGGDFESGFLSAGFAAGTKPWISKAPGTGNQLILTSVAGGTASSLGGGKFANGAVTAAIRYAHDIGPSNALNAAGDAAGKIWNLPNTAIGAVFGGVGHVTGEIGQGLGIWSREPMIGFGNNALEFTGNPFAVGGAITLGNTITWSVGRNSQFYFAHSSHEQFHTLQGQFLGPFYIPAQAIGMGSSLLTTPFSSSLQRTAPGATTYFHGKTNFMEGPFLENKLYE